MGHELVGRVAAAGDEVVRWSVGDRVGAGWHGGHRFHCEACDRGQFLSCEEAAITGPSFDGGYAEYATVPQEAAAAVPTDLGAVEGWPSGPARDPADTLSFSAPRVERFDLGDVAAAYDRTIANEARFRLVLWP